MAAIGETLAAGPARRFSGRAYLAIAAALILARLAAAFALPTLQGPLLYVTRRPKFDLPSIAAQFSKIKPLAVLARMRSGRTIENYCVYSLGGLHGPAIGRLANAP